MQCGWWTLAATFDMDDSEVTMDDAVHEVRGVRDMTPFGALLEMLDGVTLLCRGCRYDVVPSL
jgi:hypothetical protein